MRKWLLLALLAGVWWWLRQPDTLPLEQHGSQQTLTYTMGAYRITPLQNNFFISARVLGSERYFSGREADLSPIDLALGWGPMADPDIIRQFTIRQSNRWYFWRTDKLPIARRDVEINSANMHMIPANDDVARQLLALNKGDFIELSGQLVRVDADDGWHWVSSLSREDTGQGACEVVLVESVRVTGL